MQTKLINMRKQRPNYLARVLLLSIAISPLGSLALAADITTPITVSAGDNRVINDDVKISDLGNSKYALGTAGTIRMATSITFNGKVDFDITNSVKDISLLDASAFVGTGGSVAIGVRGEGLNIKAQTDHTSTNSARFAAIHLSRNVNLDVENATNISIVSTDTFNSYASFGSGRANFEGDLSINMQGGKTVCGLSSSYTLQGANNTINITSSNSAALIGLNDFNEERNTGILSKIASATTNINIKDTGNRATSATGIGGATLAVVSGATVNINVDSFASGLTGTDKYLTMDSGSNGLIVSGSAPNELNLDVAQGAQLNITVTGSAVDIDPNLEADKNVEKNTGLSGATGIASARKAVIGGGVNIKVLSPKGVGIKVISYNPDAAIIYGGEMHFNGTTIVNAAGGYALLSATSSRNSRNLFGHYIYWGQRDSSIHINERGGSLVQLTGDIDHMSMFNSHYQINLDTADSFLHGAALLSNVRQHTLVYLDPVLGNRTDISIANGATWYMTGKSDINLSGNSVVNQLQFGNQGLLDMTASDTLSIHTYEQLNVNVLAGDNGRILMNTNLQESFDNKNVKASSDRIYIEKNINQYEIDHPNTAAAVPPINSPLSVGTHTIDIKDSSLLNKIPAEGYLLLVEDHTQVNAKFVGGQLQKGGVFKYQPIITDEDPNAYSNIPADSNNWYLTGFSKIGLEEEAIVNIGLAESRYIAYMNEQDTLIKRLGELRQHDKEQGIWARVRGANNSVDGFGVHRNSYVSTHLGYDWKLKEQESSKAKRYMGIAFNHTNNNFDYAARDTGKGMSNVLTVYGTRLGDKGHYLDLVGKVGRMSNNYKYQGQQLEANNWFYSVSAEYGRSIVREKGWYYEPQLQFTFGHINGASYGSKESCIEADGITSAILRAGVLAGRKFNEDKPEKNGSYYAKLFWNHEFAGNVQARISDIYGDRLEFGHSYSGSWMTVGLGTSLNINKTTNIYIDLEKAFSGKVNGGWAWQGGVRWRF